MPLRLRLEGALENLIALLDEIDGDPDLEEEPDREEQHDRELDEAELSGVADLDGLAEFEGEPSLGATLALDQRIAWRRGRGRVVTDEGAAPVFYGEGRL